MHVDRPGITCLRRRNQPGRHRPKRGLHIHPSPREIEIADPELRGRRKANRPDAFQSRSLFTPEAPCHRALGLPHDSSDVCPAGLGREDQAVVAGRRRLRRSRERDGAGLLVDGQQAHRVPATARRCDDGTRDHGRRSCDHCSESDGNGTDRDRRDLHGGRARTG
ncbi:hypothetical protein ACFPRL_00880 [Pseudoclavibacter helvolus]